MERIFGSALQHCHITQLVFLGIFTKLTFNKKVIASASSARRLFYISKDLIWLQ